MAIGPRVWRVSLPVALTGTGEPPDSLVAIQNQSRSRDVRVVVVADATSPADAAADARAVPSGFVIEPRGRLGLGKAAGEKFVAWVPGWKPGDASVPVATHPFNNDVRF